MKYSWQNDFKIGYNHEWFTFRKSELDRLDIQFSSCGRQHKGLSFESVNTANIISEEYKPSNIAILYSGDVESEAVLLSFIASRSIPNRVIFLDNGINNHSKNIAQTFCKFYEIPLEIISIDLRAMLASGEADDICAKYQCSDKALSAKLKVIESICKTNYIVTTIQSCIKKTESEWNYKFKESEYSIWKVLIDSKVDGCPSFVHYTPELWLSFIDDPIFQWILSSTMNSSDDIKSSIYQNRLFVKPRAKFIGTETLYSLQAVFDKEVSYPFDKMYYEITRFIK